MQRKPDASLSDSSGDSVDFRAGTRPGSGIHEEPGVQSTPLDLSFLFELARSHFGVIAESSKLVAAETRLALASSAQLFALGILGAFIAMVTWICLVVALSILLHWLGVSLGVISAIMLVFHVLLLAVLGFAIRSTLEGMRFSATRELMSKPANTDSAHEKRTVSDAAGMKTNAADQTASERVQP